MQMVYFCCVNHALRLRVALTYANKGSLQALALSAGIYPTVERLPDQRIVL